MILLIFIIAILLIISQWYFIQKAPKEKEIEYKIVKAGDVSKSSSLTVKLNSLNNRKYTIQGEEIDISEYLIFVVNGESMAYNNIHSGDIVFIKELIGETRLKIPKDKIILLEIDDDICCSKCNETGDSEYKLRKFIGYLNITEVDVEEWTNQYEITNKKEYLTKFERCKEKYKDTEDIKGTFLCSTTMKDYGLSYSFHPIRLLKGVVEYVLPKDRI